MQETTLNFNSMEWQTVTENSHWAGAKIKILRKNGKNQTFLVELPAGFRGQPHVFPVNEQHIVLEGSFQVEDETYGQGTFRFNPAGNAHDGKYSADGALILVIQDPYVN